MLVLQQFFSAGEDAIINMWQTNEDGTQVDLLHSERVHDKMLSGLAFISTGKGEKVAAASYDCSTIHCWSC
jgi:WD40 repeat protein